MNDLNSIQWHVCHSNLSHRVGSPQGDGCQGYVTSHVTNSTNHFSQPHLSRSIYCPGPRFWLPSSRVADFQMGPVCRERELKFWTQGLVDLATQYAIAFVRHDWPDDLALPHPREAGRRWDGCGL